VAAAMSTVDSALNCSATVSLIDFQKKFFNPEMSERASIIFLRTSTVVWGILGTIFALLMIRAESALDVWWQISGIFGGGILGLFLLSLFRTPLRLWQGIVAIAASILTITWGTFVRELPEAYKWAECTIDEIIIGAIGTAVMLIIALAFGLTNRSSGDTGASPA
jgi:SSS family solute:Na+ symporter